VGAGFARMSLENVWLRRSEDLPVTMWPEHCQQRLKRRNLLVESLISPILVAESKLEAGFERRASEGEAEAFRVVDGDKLLLLSCR